MEKQSTYTQSKQDECLSPKINHTYILKCKDSQQLPDIEQK